MKRLFAIFFCCAGFTTLGQVFQDNFVHEIEIVTQDDSLWSRLQSDYKDLLDFGEKSYQCVQVIIDGDTVNNVGLRWKGAYSNTGFPGMKKPLKIDFSEFVEGQRYQGLKKLNLANFALDPSFMRDKIAYELHRERGNPAPETAYCNVFLNNELIGLYLVVEQIDKRFLKKHFHFNTGNLYKCVDDTEMEYIDDQFDSYSEEFELRTNKQSENHENFIGFLRTIKQCNTFNANPKLEEYFAVEEYLNVLVTDVFMNNWDSYYGNGRNFYLYNDPLTNQLFWIPWDYNLSFSPYLAYVFPHDKSDDNFKPLIKRIEENACLRNRYLEKTCKLLKQLDRPYWYARIDELKWLISNSVEMDTNKFYSTSDFHQNVSSTTAVNKPNSSGALMKVEYLPGIKEVFDLRPNELQRDLRSEDFKCGEELCKSCLDIRAFPNPSNGHFKVEVSSFEDFLKEFSIVSAQGKLIYSQILTDDYEHFLWESFDLPKGVYILSASTMKNRQKTQKLVIQ